MRSLALALVLLAAGCSDDAPGPDFTFTGAYEDWSSTETNFLGVNGALVVEVANPDNMAMTAPNGRSTLTLPGEEGQVELTASDYLPGRYTVDPDAAAIGPYEVRGMKTADIGAFYNDIGAGTWDESTVLVEIENRTAGVTVTVNGATGIGYTDAYTVFPNVDASSGTVSLEVDAGSHTCHAPSTLHVSAGEVAMTTVACE
jgi:hypothetical protein